MVTLNPFEVTPPLETVAKSSQHLTPPFTFGSIVGEDDVREVLHRTVCRYVTPLNGFLVWCLIVGTSVGLRWARFLPDRYPSTHELRDLFILGSVCAGGVTLILYVCYAEIKLRAKKVASEISGQIGEETFSLTESRGSYQWPYESISRCRRVRGYFVFTFEEIMRPMIVPERAFASLEEADAAWAWLEVRVTKTTKLVT